MNLIEYEELARRTLKKLPVEDHILHMSMGLIGEIGELVDAVKKHLIYGKDLDIINVIEELGDTMYYAIGLCKELEVDIEKAATAEIEEDGTEEPESTGAALVIISVLIAENCREIIQNLEVREAQKEHLKISVTAIILGVRQLVKLFDLDLSGILTKNINKLAARYGDKYSDYAAINRDTSTERKILGDNK